MLQSFCRNIVVLVALMVWAHAAHTTVLDEMIDCMHILDQTEFYRSYMKDPDADAHMMQQMIGKLQKMQPIMRVKSYKSIWRTLIQIRKQ